MSLVRRISYNSFLVPCIRNSFRLLRVGNLMNMSFSELCSSGVIGTKDHLTVTSDQSREPDIHEVKVTKVVDVSPTVKKLFLQPTSTPIAFTFKAGQWVDMFIPRVEQVGGFSITSSPKLLQKSGEFHLAVKSSDSPPSKWVHTECKPGSTAAIRIGGNFFLNLNSLQNMDADPSILFIAGGVGINPLASMIFDLSMKNFQIQGRPIHAALLYSAKTSDELIFKSEFDEIGSTTGFKTSYFITKEHESKSVPGRMGMGRRISHKDVQDALFKTLKLPQNSELLNQRVQAYLCGPPEMITFMRDCLQRMQITNVFHEKWW